MLGVVLRVAMFLANRSLWLDEALLALNVLDRDLAGLLEPLAFNQGAPAGFLAVQELVVAGFGASEYAFRFVPLLAGIAALPLFAVAAKRSLGAVGATVAVCLLAIAEGAIYYSAENKQYSTDVLAALVLLLAARPLARGVLRTRTAIGLVVVAVLAVALSHAAILVAPALALAALAIRGRSQLSPRALPVLVGGSWIVLAAISGFLARSQLANLRTSLFEAAARPPDRDAPAKLAADPIVDAVLGLKRFAEAQASLLGLPTDGGVDAIAAVVFAALVVLGATTLLRRKPETGLLLVAPVLATLVVIAVEQYPLLQRTTLFLLPFTLLLACAGLEEIARVVGGARGAAAATVAALFLFVPAAKGAIEDLVRPRHFQELRPALVRIREDWQPGDALYVHYAAQYAFAYYQQCGCIDLSDPRGEGPLWPASRVANPSTDQFAPALRSAPPTLHIGANTGNSLEGYIRDIERLRGRDRVWFVFTHASTPAEARVEYELLPAYLDEIGTRKASFEQNGARVYLYDLRS